MDNAYARLIAFLAAPEGEQRVCIIMGLCPDPSNSLKCVECATK